MTSLALSHRWFWE